MFRRLVLGIVVMLTGAQPGCGQNIERILASEYEYSMISSGNNFPGVDLHEDHLGEICTLLHTKVSLGKIRAHFRWSEQELKQRIQTLIQEGLIKQDRSGRYRPTVMVISKNEARKLTEIASAPAGEAVRLIATKLPEIQRLYGRSEALQKIAFPDASLFVLSDVLLDNWQIDNVEKRVLRVGRTLRNGKHYYFAALQKEGGLATEAFGIYGNSVQAFGDVYLGLYGNQRQALNFQTLSATQLADFFGGQPADHPLKFKQELIVEFVRFSGNLASGLGDVHQRGFERLGWLKDGKPALPILRDHDGEILSALAGLLTDDLVALLERVRPTLEQAYRHSNYADEVTFQEYFIWWYHFFYTEVTERLITEGFIVRPPFGVFTFLAVE